MKTDLIRELRAGWLTPLGALQKVRCLSLSQRVGELRRDGYTVQDAWSRLNDGKRVKRYRITGVPK
jgi:hypothetical protein